VGEQGIDAYMADRSYGNGIRLFPTMTDTKHGHGLRNGAIYEVARERFTAKDFSYEEKSRTCRCPAGQRLIETALTLMSMALSA
jgi:hypothetical protein